MPLKLAARQLPILAIIMFASLVASSAAQSNDASQREGILTCPATSDPAQSTAGMGSSSAAGAENFDYSLLLKRRGQLAPTKQWTHPDALSQARMGGLTGPQTRLRPRAAAPAAAEQEPEPNEPSTYQSEPADVADQASIEAPWVLSTALSAHGRVPLQMQTAAAATGVAPGARPTRFTTPRPIASNRSVSSARCSAAAASRPQVARVRSPARPPSRAAAILMSSGGV